MNFELGKYYWYDAPNNGGYYKCVKAMSNSVSAIGRMKCLWRTKDVSARPIRLMTKVGDVKTYSKTPAWADAQSSGPLQTDFIIPCSQPLTVIDARTGRVSPPSAIYKQWTLYNYKDLVSKITTGETFMDKHWGEIEVVGFSTDPNMSYPRGGDAMIEVVRIYPNNNDPQPVCYLYWDEFFDRCAAGSPDVGCVCVSCKRDYPYAVAAVNFKCWGCKNGA